MKLKLTSPDFEDGGWIPDLCSGYGADLSPAFCFEGISENAKTLILTMDDLGLPFTDRYNHWIAWNIPPMHLLPRGLPKGDTIDQPIHAVQGLAYGKHGYRGPKPPFNWNHEYLFTMYTLDCVLDLSSTSRRDDVLKAAEGHILQQAELRGWYQRKHTV